MYEDTRGLLIYGSFISCLTEYQQVCLNQMIRILNTETQRYELKIMLSVLLCLCALCVSCCLAKANSEFEIDGIMHKV